MRNLLCAITIFLCSLTAHSEPLSPAEKFHSHEHQRNYLRFAQPAKNLRPYSVTQYALSGNVDWKLHKIDMRETISLNLNPEATIVELDSHVSVSRVLFNGEEASYAQDSKNGLLKIDLQKFLQLAPLAQAEVTIFYQASESKQVGLLASPMSFIDALKGEPIQGHVFYTFTEPQLSSYWFPCNDNPANRAKFSAEFTMNADEQMISNGDLVFDQFKDGKRTMRYSTRYPLPTYLMAVALGHFNHVTRQHGSIPLSIWTRKGLAVDSEKFFDKLEETFSMYEKLLGPYAFEKYSIVFLPNFGGGEENAGITFESEGLETGVEYVTRHELAHQWFGDLMTVESWDDLWIKEGMATHMEFESSRPAEDLSHSGAMFGPNFYAVDGDAISDPKVPPNDKYGSGSYERAAWMFAQVRHQIGDDAFWQTWRGLLKSHMYGNITSQEVIDAFALSGGEDLGKKMKAALYARGIPHLDVTKTEGARDFEFDLQDKDATLLFPVTMKVFNADGSAKLEVIRPGMKKKIMIPEDAMIALEPEGLQPVRSFLPTDPKRSVFQLSAQILPKTDNQLAQFLTLPGPVQGYLFVSNGLISGPSATLAQFPWVYAGISSEYARRRYLNAGCSVAKDSKGDDRAKWQSILLPILKSNMLGQFCGGIAPTDFLMERKKLVAASGKELALSLAEINYLAQFPEADLETALSIWSGVAEFGPSTYLRFYSLQHLGSQPNTTALSLAKLETLAERMLRGDRSFLVSQEAAILKTINNQQSLKVMAEYLSDSSGSLETLYPDAMVVCSAYAISKSNKTSWEAFKYDVGDLSTKAPRLQLALDNAEKNCK